MTRAILLLSGGLDSTLAGKLLIEQGVELEAVNLVSPFCQCTPRSASCSAAKASALQLGIPVKTFAAGDDYLDMVKHPRFGRGRNMNPCLDCRVYMLKRAKQYMIEAGADFVATGEVLGERPMSQRRDAMNLIEREAGLKGLIVRPLCAQLLQPSRAEEDGLIERERLKAISGRRRKPQMDLARELGISDYLCPGGGCLLTDAEFAARLRDLFEHEPGCGMDDVRLLKSGRHFRLESGAKVVVGRNERENNAVEKAARQDDVLLTPKTRPGPSVLCRGGGNADFSIAAGILRAYMKDGAQAEIAAKTAGGEEISLAGPVPVLPPEAIEQWRVSAQKVRRSE